MTDENYSPYSSYELDSQYQNLKGKNRYERALIILQGVNNVRKSNGGWLVKSQDSPTRYYVTIDEHDNYHCNCPDCVLHHNECKHIIAVKLSLGETVRKEPKRERHFSEYNKAMCDEFSLFPEYLKELIDAVVDIVPASRVGRPSIPLKELIGATITKIAHQLSSRRGMGVIEAEDIGNYNYSATLKFLQNENNTSLLREILHASAKPFVELESSFSIDSTGFNTRNYKEWASEKWGIKRTREFVKCHAVVGNKTNVITDAVITASDVADIDEFGELLDATAGMFNIKQFLADAGYLSNDNYKMVARINAEPLIMFKKDSTYRNKCPAWQNAYFKLRQKPDEFYADYLKRNNVESVFGAVKDKYGETLKSKCLSAQINETYCKLIAYNISVLVKLSHFVSAGVW